MNTKEEVIINADHCIDSILLNDYDEAPTEVLIATETLIGNEYIASCCSRTDAECFKHQFSASCNECSDAKRRKKETKEVSSVIKDEAIVSICEVQHGAHVLNEDELSLSESVPICFAPGSFATSSIVSQSCVSTHSSEDLYDGSVCIEKIAPLIPMDSVSSLEATNSSNMQINASQELVLQQECNVVNGGGVRLHNVMAFAWLGCELELGQICEVLGNAVYRPEEFCSLRVEVRTGCGRAVTVSLFANGKMMATGGASLRATHRAMKKVARKLHRPPLRLPIRFAAFHVANSLFAYSFGFPLNLHALHRMVRKIADYEPERFPGLRLRIPIPQNPNVGCCAYCASPWSLPSASDEGSSSHNVLPSKSSENIYGSNENNINNCLLKQNYCSNREIICNHLENNSTGCSAKIVTSNISTRFSLVGCYCCCCCSALLLSTMGIEKEYWEKYAQRFPNSVIQSNEPFQFQKRSFRSLSMVRLVSSNDEISNNSDFFTDKLSFKQLEGKKSYDNTIVQSHKECITINVFSTGNITFTGIRNLPSLHYGLRFVLPLLQKCRAKFLALPTKS